MWYLSVFAPVASEGAAEAVARAVWPDDPGAQLAIPLLDADNGAWVGGNAAVTDAEIAAMQGLALVPGARWYRFGLDGGFAASSHPGPEAGAAWGWDASLIAAGLRAVDPFAGMGL